GAAPDSSGWRRARVVEGTTRALSRSRPVAPATSRGVGSRMSTCYEGGETGIGRSSGEAALGPISRDVRVRDPVHPEQTATDSPGRQLTRSCARSGRVPGECPRRPVAGARSTLRWALRLDDFAACLRALVGTAHVDESLALARVLALA